ncbi:hypothetical protein BST91_05605 [Nonlabens tegetincola]|uniref:hypothetical protein n=1 Tax=Nonlabens tegetincola TaxID=323273 RepID=UPI000A204066|nr:hypothetical protein [Nonlabens tegetincola]ARN71161.1 hypothetical protein BST91_05605 [Nonlabens tegetincola]
MRKASYILITIGFIFISCRNDELKDNVWIGEYSTNDDREYYFSEENLISFENEEWVAKGVSLNYGEETRYGNQGMFSEQIVFNEDWTEEDPSEIYDIQTVGGDSLVLRSPNSDNFHVYRKLSEIAKRSENIDISGKQYVWSNNHFTDTIYFKENFEVLRKSSVQFSAPWQRIEFSGYDILFMYGDVPYVIQRKVGDTIFAKTFHKENIEHKFIELNKNVW